MKKPAKKKPDPNCKVCKGNGLNFGAQCKPSKKHPTGWYTAVCDCVK